MLYTFLVEEYGYRGPPARIRIFRHRNFSPDRPITHALRIPNAFWYVFSCMYAVRSHKTEVLISVRAPRIGRLKKTNSDITRRNSSWLKTFNVTIYSIIGGQSLKGVFILSTWEKMHCTYTVFIQNYCIYVAFYSWKVNLSCCCTINNNINNNNDDDLLIWSSW